MGPATHYLVIDFEATCERNTRNWPSEIIEFPIVVLDACTLTVVAEFHEYVRPTVQPQLTAFCMDLTGITQEQVDGADTISTVLPRVNHWLASHNFSEPLAVTCGDWDLKKMLPTECRIKGLAVPALLRRWCNIKKVAAAAGCPSQGMTDMLNGLSLPLIGRHHSGIDDARNIAAIAVALAHRRGPLPQTGGAEVAPSAEVAAPDSGVPAGASAHRVEEGADRVEGAGRVALRPKDLLQLWADVAAEGFSLPAVEFYGHSRGPHRSFSNFYEHAPFDFTLPAACNAEALIASGRSARTPVRFSEKAIMLCKAASMGDYASYDAIARAATAAEAKKLGRSVAPWSQQTWDAVVCTVAREVVLQKFRAVAGLDAVLLRTGTSVIAEMTRNDANWGTGVDVGRAPHPASWRGTNILGWALMAARAQLAKELATPFAGQPASSGVALEAELESEAEPEASRTDRQHSRDRRRARKRLQHAHTDAWAWE